VTFSKLGRPNPRAGTPRLSRKPFVIVTTYIDESGTHNDAQHIILGGSVGPVVVSRIASGLRQNELGLRNMKVVGKAICLFVATRKSVAVASFVKTRCRRCKSTCRPRSRYPAKNLRRSSHPHLMGGLASFQRPWDRSPGGWLPRQDSVTQLRLGGEADHPGIYGI
jgi:hypothetical protein